VTVGGRQNWDSKDSNFHDFGQVSAALGALSQAPFVVIQSASWSEFSPKVTLNAKFSDVGPLDKLLFYVTASKGYEAGDFTSGPTVASATGAIPPEIAKNYEAGFKSTFWNHKATLDFTVFHVDYTNLQTLSLNAAGVTQVASTNAIARGAEVGATVNPLPGLYLTADYDYLDTQIAAGAKAPDGTAVGGGKLPQSPPWSYNFQASYIHEIADNNRLRFTVAYTDKGPVYFDVKNTRTAQPQVLDLTKVKDLNAEIALLHGPWTLSVWGKNLTNREMIERVNNGSNSFDLSSAESKAGKVVIDGTILDPRSVGVTLRWTY
jgi:iron complex outermembrane receptor protein